MTDNTQPARWYMVDKDGMATLCTDREDAEQEVKDANMAWPHTAPHRAVQLVEAPAALRLAEELERDPTINRPSAVSELRRLHAENTALQQGYDAARMEIDGLRDRVQELGAMLRENCNRRIVELEAQLEAIGAGGVEPLRRRECLHQIAEPAPAPAAVARTAKTQSIFALQTEPKEGESQWGGIYSNRANAEYDAEVMRNATGREWHVVKLVEASSATAPSTTTEAAAPADVEVPSGWRFNVSRSDGRIWLTISTQNGASASLSAAENTENEDDTIVAQVLDFLADSLAAPTTHAAPAAQGDAEDAARYRCIRRGQHWSVIDGSGNELRAEALDSAIDAARKQGEHHD